MSKKCMYHKWRTSRHLCYQVWMVDYFDVLVLSSLSWNHYNFEFREKILTVTKSYLALTINRMVLRISKMLLFHVFMHCKYQDLPSYEAKWSTWFNRPIFVPTQLEFKIFQDYTHFYYAEKYYILSSAWFCNLLNKGNITLNGYLLYMLADLK